MKYLFSYLFILIIFTALFSGCKEEDPPAVSDPSPPNILLIISDDIGKDATNGFPEGNVKPNTPNLNTLKDAGLTFNNFWAYPTCSPTRAAIITGKYGYRTGVKWANDAMNNSETILQEYIDQHADNDYATAIIGKWHLSGMTMMPVNPENFGMDYYAGLIGGGVRS